MEQNYNTDDTFLARWLNDDLTEAELTDFKESEDYLLYQKIAEKSTLFQPPAFDEQKSFQKIKEKTHKQKQKVYQIIPVWMYGMAATILILLGLTYFINSNTNITSLKGEQLAYVLPDGSEVLLNGASTIRFAKKDWEKGNRSLKLEGEGYFKVKKGSTFSVKTSQGIVSVLGTQFNVQTVKDYLSVACYQGKVQVAHQKFKSTLTQGKGVRVLANKKINFVVTGKSPNWMQQNYQYNAVPLNVVFKDLENVYKITIIIQNIDVYQKYTGKLLANDLNKDLLIVCKSIGLSFKTKYNKIVVYK